MATYFTDSSAATKRYLSETGSGWVKGLFTANPSHRFFAVAVIGVEVVAAISRRARGGTISQADAAAFCTVFLADLRADFRVVPVTDALLHEAIRLAQRYSLRGYDAVQLAAANEVNRLRVTAGARPIIFVSADQELNAAARSEGLSVDDPNAHL
jgi:predicted nucleic acid-binding protein